jgi:hypothetical protein
MLARETENVPKILEKIQNLAQNYCELIKSSKMQNEYYHVFRIEFLSILAYFTLLFSFASIDFSSMKPSIEESKILNKLSEELDSLVKEEFIPKLSYLDFE